MYDLMIDHAVRTTWCVPNQDNQVIIKPQRITPRFGVWNIYSWQWLTLTLPVAQKFFHIYQVGQLHPAMLNLFAVQEQWVSIAEACNRELMVADVYVSSGVQLPRIETWYYVTREKNILIAVMRNDAINFNFNDDDVFLRVYDNAYFQSLRSAPQDDYVKVYGARTTSMAQLLEVQTQYEAYRLKPGGTYCFVNGYKKPNISILTANVGDVVEFVYDSSIKRVIDWSMANLPTFDSTVDNKGKYLLHYSGTDPGTIDYFDDIDLFMVSASMKKGVYVHKNAADTIRMLTHRDYSVTAAYVNAYLPHFINSSTGTWDLSDLYLRMHVRKSGLERPLVDEHHRIHELYKLQDGDLVAALLGIDSTVPVWRADNLEAAKYPAIMQAREDTITQDMARDAYGYNAVAKLAADTPQVLEADRSTQLPWLLRFNAMVYEYDADGYLLGWHLHTSGPTCIAVNPQAKMIEALYGPGEDGVEEFYDQRLISLDEKTSYRYYIQRFANGELTGVWEDVTGNASYYTATSTRATWVSDDRFVTLTRSDKKHFIRRYAPVLEQGLISVKIQMRQTRYGQEGFWPLEIPFGEVDVFLNGKSLIHRLDYYVDEDTIFIVNKRYMVNDGVGAQDVVVRMTGFCTSDLKLQMANEFGYLQQGRISVNKRFDIHDGKVLRIIAGGKLYAREELNFSEDTQSYDFLDERNGQPYLIRDLVVPMRSLVNANTYTYRAASLAVDKQVSDYMTRKVPQDTVESVNPISERYPLYSPFFAHLVWACQNNYIDEAEVSDHYSDDKVRALCQPYEYLLANDPVHVDNQHNPDYVVVHPTCRTVEVNLGLPHYRFLGKAVRLYGNGWIELSPYIKLV